MQESKRTKHLKYTEYRINKNILVSKLRNRLIEMMLEEDNAKKGCSACMICRRASA